jgi:hypothetical protein
MTVLRLDLVPLSAGPARRHPAIAPAGSSVIRWVDAVRLRVSVTSAIRAAVLLSAPDGGIQPPRRIIEGLLKDRQGVR